MKLPLKWEFPGGKVEPGESETDCIVREIKEELGLDILPLRQGPTVYEPHGQGDLLELIPFVCAKTSGELSLREHAQACQCTPLEMRALDWAAADIEIMEWWVRNAAEICTNHGLL